MQSGPAAQVREAVLLRAEQRTTAGRIGPYRRGQAKMAPTAIRHHASTGGAYKETLLDEEGFDHVSQGATFLAEGRRQRLDAHRPAIEILDDRAEQAPIECIESFGIHLEHVQGVAGDRLGDATIGTYLGKVPHPAQQPVGDSWRAARTLGNLRSTLRIAIDAQNARRTAHDLGQLGA